MIAGIPAGQFLSLAAALVLAGGLTGILAGLFGVGLLYTAKGTASLLIPLSSVLFDATGKSWTAVFIVAAVLNIIAAVMALVVLKPMRRRFMAEN